MRCALSITRVNKKNEIFVFLSIKIKMREKRIDVRKKCLNYF